MKRKFKILIVDDDGNIRSTLKDILKEKGFIAHEARDGDEACAIMRRHLHDLIFMDIKMPHLDGFMSSTFIQVKSPKTQVIFMTGYQKNEKIKRILEVIPKSEWLKKPMDIKRVLEIAENEYKKYTKNRDMYAGKNYC